MVNVGGGDKTSSIKYQLISFSLFLFFFSYWFFFVDDDYTLSLFGVFVSSVSAVFVFVFFFQKFFREMVRSVKSALY